jgi:regulator of protease activity HflC (stomatin/prohibitin superfamily)
MNTRLNAIVHATRLGLANSLLRLHNATRGAGHGKLLVAGMVVVAGCVMWKYPPLQTVERGELGIRTNQFTGYADEFSPGTVMVLPGLHQLRRFSMRDQVYRPGSEGSFQSIEGLSLGLDLTVRYALDPAKMRAISRDLPEDIAHDTVPPAVQGVIYKTLARYTVREIFSSRRAEITQALEAELKPRLATDGLVLKGVLLGKVDLPPDYKRGMENLLTAELETEKMKYTLELKDKQVQETALVAEADKVRRQKAAEAQANEQIIAARAQEEAMKHVLPFKQKQIEQRQLEAEAEKQARVKGAEATAQARRIEANGEADSRQKLADAEVYRLEKVGKANSEQMAREGVLITKHPLLIQKTLADKLSDKIQVIIAPPPTSDGFIGASLVGGMRTAKGTAKQQVADDGEEGDAKNVQQTAGGTQ